MAAIHLVERLNNLRKLSADPPVWESGYWVVSEESAERLVGGDLYLHSGQQTPSHFGGTILGYRVHRDGTETDGRVVFRIAPSQAHKGYRLAAKVGGNEKKFVW